MRHIILISGKDSLAAGIVQSRLSPALDYEYIHNPTGLDLPEFWTWLAKVEEFLGVKIKGVGDDLLELTYDKGILPSVKVRYCTQLAKILPLEEYLSGSESTVYYGLRHDEPLRVGYQQRSKNVSITPAYPLRDAKFGINEVWMLLDSFDLLPPAFYWSWMESRVEQIMGRYFDSSISLLAPWQRRALFAWRTRSNCDRCFFMRQYEWIGLLEHHPDRFEDACKMERDIGAKEFTIIQGTPLPELAKRAPTIKEKRAKAIAKTLFKISQGGLFSDSEGLADVLEYTSCGLLCGYFPQSSPQATIARKDIMKFKLEQHPKDFACAVCATDLRAQVENEIEVRQDLDETIPSRVALHCDKCATDTEFRLEWELVLRHAEPIPYEIMP